MTGTSSRDRLGQRLGNRLAQRLGRRVRSVSAGTLLLAVMVSGCSQGSDQPEPSDPSRTTAPSTGTDNSSQTQVQSSPDGGGVPAAWQAAVSEPAEDPYYAETSNPEVDVLHYQLDLDYQAPRLRGVVTVTFRAAEDTDTIRLDLSDALEVASVRLDDTPAAYRHQADGLVTKTAGIAKGSVHALVITYAGVPRAAPVTISRFDPRVGVGWQTGSPGEVYTFQEPYGAWTWFPSNDHPSDEAFFDATITTDPGDVGVFNGTMESSTKTGGRTTARWHLDEPAATYLVTLAIGPYREYTAKTASGLRLSFWLLDRDRRYLAEIKRRAVRSFDWLVDHAGPYPFSSLGFVIVGGTDAMETQTMVTLGRGEYARSESVIEHEMAHQWFGDSVSPVDWKGMWINEGWAMYMQQWYERDFGLNQYDGGIDQWRFYDNTSRMTAGPPGDYDPRYWGDLNVYLGPAMMLDKIRQRIGDQKFGAFVKAWAADHAGQNVDRADFTSWVNHETGQNFTPLINRWLDSRTTPPF